jgi:DNA-binding NarL/FixJ family response regulator
MAQEIRILLVHDQDVFPESMEHLLREKPDFEIVGNCASAQEAIAVLKRDSVDVVLVDCVLGVEQRLGFLEVAKRAALEGRVLITTTRLTGGAVLRALERGALGIVMRQSPPCELVKAIHRVASGELWLDSVAVRAMAAAVRSGEHRIWQPLNVRERAVLKAVVDGLKNKQIAVELRIPESSVKYIIRRLFAKAGVRTRSQLVRIALQRHAQDWLPAL